jgi:type I restriction enzyme, R subunit
LKNEKYTRQEIIDAKMLLAGWNVQDTSQVVEEFSINVSNIWGVAEMAASYKSALRFSDYVLLGSNGKPLAVVEAKKTSVDAEIGQEQAKQYCLNI